LRRGARRWASLEPSRKIETLTACRSAVARNAQRWTSLAASAKGIAGTSLEGQEAMTGPWAVLVALNDYLETLREIDRFGAPRLDRRRVKVRADGQIVSEVFPRHVRDRVLLPGVRAQVWMEPGVTAQTLHDTMGTWYRRPAPEPRIVLVLGAANITAIPLLDVLSKLVAEGAACILKMHPMIAYLGPVFEEAFAPLVEGEYLRFAYGDAETGKYLCAHPAVDAIHITGSSATYQAIVALGLGKPITSELGNVSPTIVLPGPWSGADLRFHAEHVATSKLHNAGFNCVAAQVLILPQQWEQRQRFLECLHDAFRDAADRAAYYPGARDRSERFAAGKGGRRYGRSDADFVARAIFDADARDSEQAVFLQEAFCTLLAIVTLPGELDRYLGDAVAFANQRLWGSLAAHLIVHPATARRHAKALDAAIARLRYGCIGVNAWSGLAFLLPPVPWGAYRTTHPGSDSGLGVVHNSRLFARSQKAVVHAGFTPFARIKPPWFLTHRQQAEIGRELCEFELRRSPARLAKIAVLGMRG
jgi:aldehyde dehydrogenase (NAD(P)+)